MNRMSDRLKLNRIEPVQAILWQLELKSHSHFFFFFLIINLEMVLIGEENIKLFHIRKPLNGGV